MPPPPPSVRRPPGAKFVVTEVFQVYPESHLGQVLISVKVTTNLNLQRPPKPEPLSTPVEDYRRFLLVGINDLLSEACVDLLFENSGMTLTEKEREII